MKKIIFLIAALTTLASCQKEPDMAELSDNLAVVTNYDATTQFGTYSTYYIPDSIIRLNSGTVRPSYWTDDNAMRIIDTFKNNMEAAGYTFINNPNDADLGIQLSYMEQITNYIYYPYWWWDYPYWDPFYWGPWDGWIYPVPVVYTYATGAIIAEMVTPKNPIDNKIPVVWSAYMTGGNSGDVNFDTSRAVTATNQAFEQSPYLQAEIQ